LYLGLAPIVFIYSAGVFGNGTVVLVLELVLVPPKELPGGVKEKPPSAKYRGFNFFLPDLFLFPENILRKS
jgi:hypothetical protein